MANAWAQALNDPRCRGYYDPNPCRAQSANDAHPYCEAHAELDGAAPALGECMARLRAKYDDWGRKAGFGTLTREGGCSRLGCCLDHGHTGAHAYRCAGPNCPGYGWRASEQAHPPTCNERRDMPVQAFRDMEAAAQHAVDNVDPTTVKVPHG